MPARDGRTRVAFMPDSSPDSRVPEREAPQPPQAPEALASDALGRSRIAGLGSRAAVAFAVPIAAGLFYLAAEDAFEVHSSLAASVVAIGAIAIVGLFVLGLRDLQRAEARTAVALDRARAAEENERRRADDLARILVASQSLRLA